MRVPSAAFFACLLAWCPAPLVRGDDPQVESDEVLREIIRRAVGEVEAQNDPARPAPRLGLAKLLATVGDKDRARELMLLEAGSREVGYKEEAERSSKAGRPMTSSILLLTRIARSLHDAGFDEDARALLGRTSQLATSTENPLIVDYLQLMEAQNEVGDRDGARNTRDRGLRVIEARQARQDAQPADEKQNPMAMVLRSVLDQQLVRLHVLAGDVPRAFVAMEAQIDKAEKLMGDHSQSEKSHEMRAATAWIDASAMAQGLAETLAKALPPQEARPHIDRILELNRRMPPPISDMLDQQLAPILAQVGDDAAAVRILRRFEEEANEKPRSDSREPKELQPFLEWRAKDRKFDLWKAQLAGWIALGRTRKERKEAASAVQALDEVETLLRNPAPPPGPMPAPPGLAAQHPGSVPLPGNGRNPDASAAAMNMGLAIRALRITEAAALLAELGERDRALALTQLLPLNNQLLGFSPIIQALDHAQQRELADEVRRQALETALEALSQLDATPLPEPRPSLPSRPMAKNAQGERPNRPATSRPASSNPRGERSPREVREFERSQLLTSICGLQAALGEVEGANETAGTIPAGRERTSAHGNIVVAMARRGRTAEALDRALALEAPEPRLSALLSLAQTCDEILTERKDKAEK
jgi:hypothetical protein